MQTRLKAIVAEMDALDAKPSRTSDEETKYVNLLGEGQALKTQITSSASGDELRSWMGQSKGMLHLTGGVDGGATVEGLRAAGTAVVENSILVDSEGEGLVDDRTLKLLRNPDYAKAFRSYLRKGERKMTDSDGLKVLQEGSDTAGGYLVPEDLLNRIIARTPTPTRLAGRVTQFNTSRDTAVMPKANYTTDNLYTSGMRVTWTGEVPASATAHRVTEPVFGNTKIPIYTAMMSLPLTKDLVEDNAFNVVGWCEGKFSETNELLRDNMILNGSGVNQPHGILVNPGAADNPGTTVSTVADALTWEGLQNILWAVPEQYEDNSTWTFNKSSTGLAISKLVDGDGRPLWTNGAADSGLVGSPKQSRLLGYEVLYSGFAPDVAADAYPIVFGDLRGYFLANRIGFSIEVLRELYAESNQILLLGRVRFGGLAAEPFRLRIQKVSA
jgi:HK97 family phage major capsid protein